MANTATSFLSGLEGRFEFGLYSNLNLPRGSGSGILLNLIPEPQVQNRVQTGFGRFGNWTTASLDLNSSKHYILMLELAMKPYS